MTYLIEPVSVKYRQKKARELVNERHPWMWAVRHSWDFGVVEVDARASDEELVKFFLSKVGSSDVRVWVRHASPGDFPNATGVQEVRGNGRIWAHALISPIPPEHDIYNIVLNAGERFIIYYERGDRGYKSLLQKVVRNAREA